MGHGRGRLRRNLWASLAVLGTVAVIGLGLPGINRLLPAARPVSASAAYVVAAGVTVRPPSGARLDVANTEPGPREGSALFLIGNVRYAVVVTMFRGSLADAATRLRTKIEETGARVVGRETSVTTDQGIVGRAGRYAPPHRAGRYAVFVTDGLAVEVTAAGRTGDLPATLPALAASTRSLAFRSAS
ncbi:MAG TPA: hypothetical protein VH442_04095 [Micromonosporaceae bacterium]|jgi:hypothetical protein